MTSHRKLSLSIALGVLILFSLSPGQTPIQKPAELSPESAAALRTFVGATLKQWHVAGAAVGIVKDGRIAFLDGFGTRDAAQNLPVTPKTRFILGSTTKAFTTAALGLLVAEKKLEWDKPVASYLPEFRLKDEYASAHATVRDLASHRTGLPRHDFVWVNSPMSLSEMVASLRHLEPSRELRAAFQYNNLMYITLGLLVERVSGMPWDEFLRQRVFKPLGMNDSGCTIPELQAAPERATAYRWEGDAFQAQPLPVPSDKLMYGARASGSVNTTAEDMCAWINAQLQTGPAGSKAVLPPEIIRVMHTPQMAIPANPAPETETLSPSYGLGWMMDVYRGKWRVNHGGSTLDFNSSVVLFPLAKTGVVVLLNANTPATDILANGVSDIALGLAPIDWNKRTADRLKTGRTAGSAEKPVEGTRPAHPLEAYAGEFVHPAYGLITITVKNGGLVMDYKGFVSPLAPWHYETFRVAESDLADEKLTFQTDTKGKVAAVSSPLEPAVKDIVFERRSTRPER